MEPKDWIARNPRELLVQITLFLDALDTDAGRAKSKLTAAQLASLRGLHTALLGFMEDKEHLEMSLSAAVSAMNEGYNEAAAAFRALAREAQASSVMDDATRKAAGLTVREQTGKGHGDIPTVDDLICKPRPSGDNFLDWSGPTGSGITYDIESRTGPAIALWRTDSRF